MCACWRSVAGGKIDPGFLAVEGLLFVAFVLGMMREAACLASKVWRILVCR